jgi:hypothetical protein
MKPRITNVNKALGAALLLLVALVIWQVLPVPAANAQVRSATTSPTVANRIAVVRHAPTVTGGRVEGSLWQLLAENLALAGTATVTSDLLLPGVPTVSTSGNPPFKELVECIGDSQPSGYVVRLGGNASVSRIVTRVNPIHLETVGRPPAPSGTRDVTLTKSGESAGDFTTLRNLTLSGQAGAVFVPPGTYGRFTASGQTALVFGIANSQQPSVYNLSDLLLTGGSRLQLLGPVVITLANGLTIDESAVAGSQGNPHWLSLRVASQEAKVRGNGILHAVVSAPSGAITIDDNGRINGSVFCDRLSINGNGTLSVTVSLLNRSPVVNAGANQTITLPATASLNGAASDEGLPVCSTLAFSWSKLSGPGTVSFVDNSKMATSASFSAPGSYVLRLTASDSLLSTSAETTIIVLDNQPANPAPVISNLVAPASVPINGSAAVRFNYSDPQGDIVSLIASQSNALGQTTTTLPASAVNITATSGVVTIPIATKRLPFGETSCTLQLRDNQGNLSNIAAFTVTIIGAESGGTAPSLQSLTVQTPWRRPAGTLDRLRPIFSFAYRDADGDIDRYRIRTIKPSGEQTTIEESAKSQAIVGLSGILEKQFLTFRSTDPLGTYTVQLTLFDRNGHASNSASAAVELQESGGALPVSITGFSPQAGGAGTAVTLSGSGFDATTASNNRVELGSVPVQVIAATATTLAIMVPDGASTGRFVLHNRIGAAASDGPFTVPAAMTVSPQSPAVVVGGNLQFSTGVVSSSSTSVNWSVNGVAGGNLSTGMITAAGLYTAPLTIPAGGIVTVTATLANAPGVSGQTTVKILPPPSTPGGARLLAPVGGTVRSPDGSAAVSIPAGALSTNTEITVRVLRGSATPLAPSGMRVVGAVDFGPSGTSFSSPVTVTLPLVRYYIPGTKLSLRFYNPANGTYLDEGVMATVAANGEQATASINHFSIPVILDGAPIPAAGPPTVVSISPNRGEEGMKVPVLLTGSNLTPGLQVEMLLDGVPTADIVPRTTYALGNRAGILLHILPIRGLAAGANRVYTLRLKDLSSGAIADAPFIVDGLDELIIPFGSEVMNPPSKRYSQVDIAGTAIISSGLFDIESTGPMTITGSIDGAGKRGASATSQTCAGLGPLEGNDECGRTGLSDGRGGLGLDDDDAEAKNLGADAPATSTVRGVPRGFGGEAGRNIDVGVTLKAAAYAAACLVTFGADVPSCVEFVRNLTGAGDELADIIEGPGGKPGLGGIGRGIGGGGGGAGRIHSFYIAPLVAYTGYSHVSVLGGGGGAGGRPGLFFKGVTPDQIYLSGSGKITAEGGQGGDGSARSKLVFTSEILPFGLSPLPDISIIDLPSPVGGGGGGGGGGLLALASGGGVFVSNSLDAQVTTYGGKGGAGSSSGSIGKPGERWLSDPSLADSFYPVFDPSTLETGVTNLPRTTVRLRQKLDFGVLPIIRVEGEGGQVREKQAALAGDSYSAEILLFQGFNTVCVGSLPCSDSAMPQLLTKRVLSVFGDTDADGLSDADEMIFRTDPNNADTDGDGLNDGDEIFRETNPLNGDTDDDGLSDGDEVAQGTNPLARDTDADGVWDGAELFLASNPLSSFSLPVTIPTGVTYAEGRDGKLTMLNQISGAVAVVGNLNSGDGFGLAFDNFRRLYVANFNQTSRSTRLAIANPFNAQLSDIGLLQTSSGEQINVVQIAHNPTDNKLYGAALDSSTLFGFTGQLIKIDAATSRVTRIGAPGLRAIRSLAFNDAGELFAAVDGGAGSDRLIKLDPVTGAILQEIGAIGFTKIAGLAFDASGTLFGTVKETDSKTRIITIDPVTGVGTLTAQANRLLFSVTVNLGPSASAMPGTTFTVTNTNDGGEGSLRQAILDANTNPGADTIYFNILATGPFTIAPAFALPEITDPVVIDGYSQPNAIPNRLANGNNAVLMIELNGSGAGAGESGLVITGGGSTVRGLAINRFGGSPGQGDGINIDSGGNNVIEGNFLGTDITGNIALGNGEDGVYVASSNNLIGGTSPKSRNIISGNLQSGVELQRPGSGNRVQGNYIGTNAAGTNALPNLQYGITAFDFPTASSPLNGLIGGSTPGARNVISGNGINGILMSGERYLIQGNFIGTDVTGSNALGNGSAGIEVAGFFNVVGGTTPTEGNVIAFNGGNGISINPSGGQYSVAIRANSLFSNAGLGIDFLYDGYTGVSPNDPCDAGTSFNPQNFPVLTSAASGGGNTTIQGTLNSKANFTYTIDFFSSPSGDASGYGEGKTYLGSATVTTNFSCSALFNVTLPVIVPAGHVITATATDANGRTSEFSARIIVM